MSFWDTEGGDDETELDKLLNSDTPKLEEILKFDEIIQEIRCDNDRLIEYLSKPDTLINCVKYSLFTKPEKPELFLSYKSLQTATEIFTVNCQKIQASIKATASKILPIVVSFLRESPVPVNDHKALYFCKYISVFVRDCPHIINPETVPEDFLSLLLSQVENFSILESTRCLFDIPNGQPEVWYGTPQLVIKTLIKTLQDSKGKSDTYFHHLQELFHSLIMRSCFYLEDITPLVATNLLPEFISQETILTLFNIIIITTNDITQRSVAAFIIQRFLLTKHPEDTFGYGGHPPLYNMMMLTMKEKETQGLLKPELLKQIIPYIAPHIHLLANCFKGKINPGFSKSFLYYISQILNNLSIINSKLPELHNKELITNSLIAMQTYFNCNFFLRSISSFIINVSQNYEVAEMIVNSKSFLPIPKLPQYCPFYGYYFNIIYNLYQHHDQHLSKIEIWANNILKEDRIDYISNTINPKYSVKVACNHKYKQYETKIIPPAKTAEDIRREEEKIEEIKKEELRKQEEIRKEELRKQEEISQEQLKKEINEEKKEIEQIEQQIEKEEKITPKNTNQTSVPQEEIKEIEIKSDEVQFEGFGEDVGSFEAFCEEEAFGKDNTAFESFEGNTFEPEETTFKSFPDGDDQFEETADFGVFPES